MTAISALLAAAFFLGPGSPNAVQRISDIAYAHDGSYAHSLDLFLPVRRTDAPLVVFVHGGAFLAGDRREVSGVGLSFARQGLATAVVSYRLFPNADAQGATQDVAMAATWLVKHATDYGITTRSVFVVGHSAGAQIAALIGTNPKYFADAGLAWQSLAGIFAVSGAYDLRDLSDEPASWQIVDGHIYGETADKRSAVSPSQHIDAAAPAFVVACGSEEDNPGSCARALYFQRALHRAGVTARVIQENGASHSGMLRALIDPRDPLNFALLDFIERHSSGFSPVEKK